MRKVLVILLVLLLIPAFLYLYFMAAMSGGLKGLWYDITKPTLDPNESVIVAKRNSVINAIVKDFDFTDKFPNLDKFGVHNTDVCTEENYGWTRPLSLSSSLYTCKYISQRYYGLKGDYEPTVRAFMKYLTDNKKGLTFQPYQTEQLFRQKDWMTDKPTTNKIIAAYNMDHKDKPAKDIYDAISFLEGQDTQTLYTYSLSKDGYEVRLDFFDKGSSPSAIESSHLYEVSDTPDLRDTYIKEIGENYQYGVVVVVSKIYFKR